MTPWRAAFALLCLLANTAAAQNDTLRIASFNTELHRDGPGLLLRDLGRDKDPQIAAVVAVIARARADVLVLQGIDWDHDWVTLKALADRLQTAGVHYPHLFTAQPNSGLATGLDLDGDGYRGGAADSQGFGAFTGRAGLAVLSKHPIDRAAVLDFTDLLWRDLPDALLPRHPDGRPFPSDEALSVQRLSNTNHWVVPVILPGGDRLNLLTFQAAPPVFDGEEDRNGRRNHDEIRFWQLYLDGILGEPLAGRVVVAGGANIDPHDGEGRHAALRALLQDPRLQDPRPSGPGAAQAPDQGHRGNSALDTVDWPGVGRLRVDYILPGAEWTVIASGVDWPVAKNDPALDASRHRLVWVDLLLD